MLSIFVIKFYISASKFTWLFVVERLRDFRPTQHHCDYLARRLQNTADSERCTSTRYRKRPWFGRRETSSANQQQDAGNIVAASATATAAAAASRWVIPRVSEQSDQRTADHVHWWHSEATITDNRLSDPHDRRTCLITWVAQNHRKR